MELELSTHEEYVVLRFTGARDVHIPIGDSIHSLSIRILDLTEYLPEIPAPIRVQKARGGEGGLSFWARTVERVK